MIDFFASALMEDKEQPETPKSVEEAIQENGKRAMRFITDYYKERQLKQTFIEETLYAKGYEVEEFLKFLSKEKCKL